LGSVFLKLVFIHVVHGPQGLDIVRRRMSYSAKRAVWEDRESWHTVTPGSNAAPFP
jgi:hypothetical protein